MLGLVLCFVIFSNLKAKVDLESNGRESRDADNLLSGFERPTAT